jgi:fumarate reductase subunit D
MSEHIFGAGEEKEETKKPDKVEADKEKEKENEMIEEGKTAAILGYVPFMCFVPLMKMKDNPFAVKHGKQGLILFFIEIIAIIFLLPKISDLFWGMVILLCLACAVAGILFAIQGKDWKIPFLGDLADKIKI